MLTSCLPVTAQSIVSVIVVLSQKTFNQQEVTAPHGSFDTTNRLNQYNSFFA